MVVRARAVPFVLALLLGAFLPARPAAAQAPTLIAVDIPVDDSWDGRTIDVLPLVHDSQVDGQPELILAQRSITRDFGKATNQVGPEPDYAYVDVAGWKSPGKASLLSLAVPGTGQLYASSNRGFVFLGVEAVAVLAYVKYRTDMHERRDQYFSYVGDPNQPGSRFSFERLQGSVSAEELAKLQEIYARDPREFYDKVTTDDSYAAGWSDAGANAGQRSAAQDYIDQVNNLGRKSKFGLFTAIANHLVATADALNLARFHNIALRENLSLKIKARPGAHQSYGLTLTQKF